MARYKFWPFDVQEQCDHAKRSRYFDRGYDAPALTLIVDGTRAVLRSNGLPRFISEDPVSFDLVVAPSIGEAEVTKNLMAVTPITAFEPLFPHKPINIFIEVDNDGTIVTVGATILKDEPSHFEDSDLGPG